MKIKIYFSCFFVALLSSVGTIYAQCDPACPGEIVAHHTAGNISPQTVDITYSTVEYNSLCWITRNLGATTEADSATDSSDAAAGWYWQFNRKQGYSWNSTNGTRTPNTIWLTSFDENSDWLADNDPCALLLGDGWRVPTKDEWDSAKSWNSFSESYNTILKLHAAGYISSSNGNGYSVGLVGDYWTSTQYNTAEGYQLYLADIQSHTTHRVNSFGVSVRCCRDL